jgi:hypothetical protein
MTAPVVTLAMKALELLSNVKIADPEVRAKRFRARALNLRIEADRLKSEIRRHEINSRNGTNKDFHRRQMRRLERKRHRLNGRAVWWDNKAARIET